MTHTQLLEVEAALTNVFTSTAFKRINVLFSLSVQRMSYYDDSLSTAHTKMGGPTFVNEKVVHILEKKILEC